MKIFDFEVIKNTADCRDIAINLLGMKPKNNRGGEWVSFDNPWRPGSDSGAFSVSMRGYRDHVSDERGSVLDLVANTKYNGDMMQAQELLGEYLHLQSNMESRQKKKFVCAYDYVDAAGTMIHQTVRFEPKSFAQRRPDPSNPGEWIWSLKDIEPVLYRLPQLIETSWVCLVGGEKDVENLVSIGIPATTNPMGEGNWRESYNQFFAGKAVIVLPDRDDVGRKHAQVVAFAIKSIAKSIRVIELPFPDDADPHKDPSDWITYHRGQGHNDEAISANLKRIIKEAPILDAAQVEQPSNTQQEIINAKRANKDPFRNYDWAEAVDDKGKEKRVKSPRHINAMREDVMRRFFNFPRRIGGSLFDHDRETKKINIFDRPPELMGWIQEKSKHNIEWAKVEGSVTEPEFFASLLRNVRAYEAISGVPNWPSRPDDVYYTHGALPDPTPDASAFNEFCSFFSPSSEADWHLLRAFIASPLYYKPKVDRPLWVIDATSGQGCFAPGTGIRMFDGSIKNVEDVKVGDVLMGPDSKPRNVLRLFHGREEMFKFTYSNGGSHVVNKSHDLYLVPLRSNGRYGNKNKGRDGIIVPVAEYLLWSGRKKLNFGVTKRPITSYPEASLPIPPYILGCWLGDGSRNATAITNLDPEINLAWNEYGASLGLHAKEYASGKAVTTHLLADRGEGNIFRDALKAAGVWMNKHIPTNYLTASTAQRLELLAGLLDTDGYRDGARMFSITQKDETMAAQILDLCRSVGISATMRPTLKHCTYKGQRREGTYWQIYISRNAEMIPVRVARKKITDGARKQKHYLHYAIDSVESLGEGEYFGFELDGDHLFLGSDYTILKNTGKTKLVEMVTLLYGGDDPDCGEPAWIDAGQLNNDTTLDRSVKRLLSSTGRKKRIALLDNVTGYFRSPALATLVTQGSISGLAPYGHGEETRPNDLTWVITSNSATLDRDLSDRSQIVKLCRPEMPRPRWALEVTEFIKRNRMQVIADIIGILERGPQFQVKPCTRFREWEVDILCSILGTQEVWESTMEVNRDRQRAADGDIEDAATIKEIIRHKTCALGLNMDTDIIWLQNAVLAQWIPEMIPGFGGKSQRGCTAHLKNMVKVGLLPELSEKYESWPLSGGCRRRGFMIGYDRYFEGAKVKIVGVTGEGVIKIV